jgi:uncharacterized protein (TIGR02217 family)
MVDLVVLDERLSYGFRSVPTWSTEIVERSGGYENRNQKWARPRHEYSISYVQDLDDIQALRAFFHGRRGAARAFLMKDWMDYIVENELIGTGDGSDVTFQAVKSYDTDNPYSRTIKYLKAGTIVVTVNGSPVTPSSTTNGLITLSSPPTLGHAVRLSAEFYVPVRFMTDELPTALTHPDVGEVSGVDLIEVMV